ncbi:MAG: PEFG-CTERM sorting domain-containing protein [Nitrosarchaeum sp.]|nr:PEFG-CTERM sorting domain-containing protein [Nitrosarchaeum sp.]
MQVIGTYVIPEFGTITFLIFLVRIATIILVTRTKKVIERSIFP